MKKSIFTSEEDFKILAHMERFPEMTNMNVSKWLKQFSLSGKSQQQIHSRWKGLCSINSKFTAAKVANSDIKRKMSEFKISKQSPKEKWDNHNNTQKKFKATRNNMLFDMGITGDIESVEFENYKYEDGKITASKVTFIFTIIVITVLVGLEEFVNIF